MSSMKSVRKTKSQNAPIVLNASNDLKRAFTIVFSPRLISGERIEAPVNADMKPIEMHRNA